ncbi:Crp/Fnr family transcriptional regulator, partial [Azospirillum rugosum]
IFGEIALLDGRPRTADAVAIGDCVLLVIERRDFVPFLERSPQVAIKMLEVMCDRLRQTSLLVEDLALLDLPQRVARLLVRLGASYGRRTADGLRIDLKLSQKDLGNLIATSRESINKQLRVWQDEELIAVEHGYITLLRPEQIADYGQPPR